MIRRLTMTALTLMISAPLAAQVPDGMMMRVDRSTNAADPDDVPDVTVATMGSGFHVTTGPAVVLWKEADTASRPFTLEGRFVLGEPSSHANYYGLIYGGGSLDGERQNYMYFLIAQNGTYIVKHRAGDNVHDIQGRTESDAIVTPGDDGRAINQLSVRVGTDETEFVVNGTVVHTVANEGMEGRTDGVWGVRVNHVIPNMHIDGLGISR
jgi:hypothetical protein